MCAGMLQRESDCVHFDLERLLICAVNQSNGGRRDVSATRVQLWLRKVRAGTTTGSGGASRQGEAAREIGVGEGHRSGKGIGRAEREATCRSMKLDSIWETAGMRVSRRIRKRS
jgi:hypothetical protein